MNHEIVGGIVNSLPIEKMIAAPLVATIQAQSQMSHMLAQYVQDVGIDSDGNVRMVTMKYCENTVDTQGKSRHAGPIYTGAVPCTYGNTQSCN